MLTENIRNREELVRSGLRVNPLYFRIAIQPLCLPVFATGH